MDNYGYSSIRTVLPVISGEDKGGKAYVLTNVPVILNRVNGEQRSVTVLDRVNGKATVRLTRAIKF